jgi:hypothetical protein
MLGDGCRASGDLGDEGGVAEGFGAGEMTTAAAGVVVTLLREGSVLETTDQTFENRRDPALGWSTPLL